MDRGRGADGAVRRVNAFDIGGMLQAAAVMSPTHDSRGLSCGVALNWLQIGSVPVRHVYGRTKEARISELSLMKVGDGIIQSGRGRMG